MRPFQGRTIILMHQRTILTREIIQISHGAKITMTITTNHTSHFHNANNSSNHQPNFSNHHHNSPNHPPKFSNYQQNFPNQAPQSSFQNPQLERRMTDFERNMKRYMKNQDSLMQIIQKLEVQMSQLANLQNERQKGTLPSQPIMNSKNSQQAHLAEYQSLNQCNVVHTLRSCLLYTSPSPRDS